MKLSLKPKLFPILALTGGIVGAALRLWLFATGIDDRGLIRTDHSANAPIFILTALVLATLYLLVRLVKTTPSYREMFPASVPAAVGSWFGALGVLIADLHALSALQDRVTLISFILGLAAAAALIMLGLCHLQGKQPNVLLHSCVAVYLMIQLISQYRSWSSETQLQDYVFQLLACVFLMLGVYHRATLDADSGSCRWYLFFRYGAAFFCCLAAIGGDWLFYLSMALWTLLGCPAKHALSSEKMHLPANVQYCLHALEDAGYSAYVVGGCVRDSLLGLIPHDYDMCTSATPEQTAAVFSNHNLVRSGEKHGTIGVVLEGQVYEITTFRTEGGYTDSRHPDWVNFVTDLESDLARRDFTINAMAYSPAQGYIDPFGGQADLRKCILRTVGSPKERFEEDALRILRGMRFAARFDLTAEEETQKAMLEMSYLITYLAPERIFSELCNLLPYVIAEDLIRYAPIMTRIIPELDNSVGFDQHSPHHAYDVYTHTARTVEATPPEVSLRLAALLHDVAKPVVFSQDENGRGHFYDHATVGAQMANEILLRLRASNALRTEVVFLIEHHMTPFEPDKKLLRRRLGKYGEDAVKKLLALQKADFTSKGVDEGEETSFAQVEQLLDEIARENVCLTIKDLAIDGTDLLTLGIQPGKIVGQCINHLLNLVQDEVIANTKEELLDAAKQFLSENTEDTQ